MRVLVIFFLFLCFSLLSRHQSTPASCYSRNCPASSHPATEVQQGSAVSGHMLTAVCPEIDSENEFLINIEDEDEDVIFARKYVAQPNYFAALANALFFKYSTNTIRESPASCGKTSFSSSDTYLRQRVLRI